MYKMLYRTELGVQKKFVLRGEYLKIIIQTQK